ncbi:MAG: hypothetical protein U1E17_04050 [Geminicoccaceae bacterium]
MPARRGTPLRIERLAEALAARGHHVELLTYHLAEEPGHFEFPVWRVFGRLEAGTLPPGPTLAKLMPSRSRPARRSRGGCASSRSM